jgi:hypothetical protein
MSHVRYGLKVMLKFKLLELQTWPLAAMRAWAEQTDYIRALHRTHAPHTQFSEFMDGLVADLEVAGALQCQGGVLLDRS